MNPQGPVEAFLVAAMEQMRARASQSDQGMECAARPATDLVRQTAAGAGRALAAVEAPLLALALIGALTGAALYAVSNVVTKRAPPVPSSVGALMMCAWGAACATAATTNEAREVRTSFFILAGWIYVFRTV